MPHLITADRGRNSLKVNDRRVLAVLFSLHKPAILYDGQMKPLGTLPKISWHFGCLETAEIEYFDKMTLNTRNQYDF